MPHQRKYVPSHSGGIASQPSRAKRWISAYASQGFSSRLSRSTRWAFVSVPAIERQNTHYRSGLSRVRRTPPRALPARAVIPFLGCHSGWRRRRVADGEERLRRGLRPFDEGPGGLLGAGGGGHPLGEALGSRLRRLAEAFLPLVHRSEEHT